MASDPHAPAFGRRATEPLEERYESLLALLQLLFEVSREIGPALSLQDVLETVLVAMRKLVRFKGGSVCLVEDGLVRIAAATPAVSEDVLAARVPVGEGLAGRIVAGGEPVYSPDLRRDPRVDPALARLGTNASIVSYLGVPMYCFGQVIGLLQVDSSEVDAFSEDDRYVLGGLASQVAGAIESARRYEAVVELERLKTDFMARVSHELRTPITIMAGFTEVLLDPARDLDEHQRREFLRRIEGATARLRHLVEEVLTLTSLESGLTSLELQDVTLAAALDSTRRVCSDPARVTIECPDGLHVHADPNVLQQVVGVLVDNAITYAGSAEVIVRLRDEDVVVDVLDRGPGVPPELRPTLFERFTRGAHSEPGLGLGLPTARHLAAAIGGRVEYEPRDHGSRFSLVLAAGRQV